MIITAYNTVFGTTGTPDGFSFILAIDWFMDRMRTVTNITGDAVVTGIVASRVPFDEAEEMTKNHENSNGSEEAESLNEKDVAEKLADFTV